MRIVSLLPSATEIVGFLGLDADLVGISHECDHPETACRGRARVTRSGLPDLGSAPEAIDAAVREAVESGRALYEIDGDQLAALAPDLVLTQGICDVCAVNEETVALTLKLLPDVLPGVETLTLSATVWEGVLRDVQTLADACGVPDRGREGVATLRRRWQSVQDQPRSERRVAFIEWPDPPFSGGHWVPEQIAAAGGIDVIGIPGARSTTLQWEEVEAARPEVVIMGACGYGLRDNEVFARDIPLKGVEVWAVDANAEFSRPGPRLVDGAETLQALLGGAAERASRVFPAE